MYKLVNAWFGENRDEISLVDDFDLVKADAAQQGFDVRSTADLATGIPNTTRIIILREFDVGIQIKIGVFDIFTGVSREDLRRRPGRTKRGGRGKGGKARDGQRRSYDIVTTYVELSYATGKVNVLRPE